MLKRGADHPRSRTDSVPHRILMRAGGSVLPSRSHIQPTPAQIACSIRALQLVGSDLRDCGLMSERKTMPRHSVNWHVGFAKTCCGYALISEKVPPKMVRAGKEKG